MSMCISNYNETDCLVESIIIKFGKSYFMHFLTKNCEATNLTYLMKMDEFPVYIAQSFWVWRLMLTYHGIATLIK
jgi:hypothetical protein